MQVGIFEIKKLLGLRSASTAILLLVLLRMLLLLYLTCFIVALFHASANCCLLFCSDGGRKWHLIIGRLLLRLVDLSVDRAVVTIFVLIFLLLVLAVCYALFVWFRAAMLWSAVYLPFSHKFVILCFGRLRLYGWSLVTKTFAAETHFELTGLGW